MRYLQFVLSILLLVLVSEKLAFGKMPVVLDLHSHLWIKEGTTLILDGDFDEPTQAKSPKSLMKSKMTRASLDPSGLRVVVVSFYAHPILSRMTSWKNAFDFSRDAVQESLLRQIERAERFVAENPDWVIASEPAEARAALATGKRVLIFSIETAAGAFNTESDRELFVGQKKVSIVTFMHLSPDKLGRGVALMPGLAFLNAPIEWFMAFVGKTTDPQTGAYVNANGLSPFGKTVLEELVKRKVWIDLSHSSDQAQREIVSVLDRAGQPSLFTHTKLREIAGSERAIPKFALDRVKATKGMVGLMPTDDITEPLPARSKNKDAEACRRGIRAFSEEWERTEKAIGTPAAVVLGSDFNAPLRGLVGGCRHVALASDPAFSERGFYRGEELPRLFEAMQGAGVDFGNDPNAAVERFLTAWEKVRGPGTLKGSPDKAKRSPSG